MRDDVRQALDIGPSTTMEDRTIDITTTGRRSQELRRIEICFYRFEDSIYLSGLPGPRTRDWLVNLTYDPRFTFHLKNTVVANLPAIATVIADPTERAHVLRELVREFNARHDAEGPWPKGVLEEWVAHSPLAKVTFVESE
jgi:hypothetical protein